MVDNIGNITFLLYGFFGSLNDADVLILMERIGLGTHYDTPRDAVLLISRQRVRR